MINKMIIGKEERDMVVMQHIFLASYPDGKKEVIKTRTPRCPTIALAGSGATQK